MSKILSYKQFTYKGQRFFLAEADYELNKAKGFRNLVQGILFIVINKNLSQAKRSWLFHKLLKNKDLCNIHGKRIRHA
jgi:hypothetical protein